MVESIANKIKFLTVEDVVIINRLSIAKYGGSFGVVRGDLLESSVYAPRHYCFYKKFENITESVLLKIAAKYAFSLIKNHPFIDGNKRTGYASMNMFLQLNGVDIDANKYLSSREIEDNMVKIAQSQLSEEEFVKWLLLQH